MRYLRALAAGVLPCALFTVSVLAAKHAAVPTAAPIPIAELSLLFAALCAAIAFTLSRRS